MTFERPLALALLAAVPLAWWLHRNRSGAPVVRVASLIAFRGAAATTPSAAPRRAIDRLLVMILSAMALLALAAAGPTFGARVPAAFYVVVDKSLSTTARTCDAERRAETLLHDVAPDAARVVHELSEADGTDGLPATLAPHLGSAHAAGFPGVVLVTDANVAAMPGVAVIGPSAGAAANVAIASAVLDGDEAVVAVRNYGAKEVAAHVACADVERAVAVAAGGVGVARFAAPDRGEMATFAITSPLDDLAADDRLVVARRGGARRVRLEAMSACPHLEAALRACGVEIVRDGAAADAVVRYRSASMTTSPANGAEHRRLLVAPGASSPDAARPTSVVLRGDAIVGRGGFADVLPAPGTTLVATSGEWAGNGRGVAWSSGDRAIVRASEATSEPVSSATQVVVELDPEDPRSDWHRDPSFPAFIAAALDRLTDGPDRLVAVAEVPASESDVARDPPRTSSPDEIRAILRPAGTDPGAVRPARWLALGAGLLLGAAAFVRRA